MDREELEKIRALSNEATEKIQELLKQIKNYKSGAESFREATEILEGIFREEEKTAKALVRYVQELKRANIGDFREEILEKIEEEGKETRKEIRRAKVEILEAIEEVRTEKKRRFRIFSRG